MSKRKKKLSPAQKAAKKRTTKGVHDHFCPWQAKARQKTAYNRWY